MKKSEEFIKNLLQNKKDYDNIIEKDAKFWGLFFVYDLHGQAFSGDWAEKAKRSRTYMTNDRIIDTSTLAENTKLISLKDAAYYLVQLYFQVQTTKNNSSTTECSPTESEVIKSYRCTRTKVEKLLAIANLINMKTNGISLFSEEIIINDCGVGISRINDMLVGEIIPGTEKEENTLNDVLKNAFNPTQTYPPRYQPSPNFTLYAKNIIKDVFFRFGNYSAHYLGEDLFDKFKYELKSNTPISNTGKYAIDTKKAHDFFTNAENRSIDNELIQYIFNYQPKESTSCE